MPKVKITNLKPGACVVNSLRMTIPGYGSVLRDASVSEDSDLIELQSYGAISIVAVDNDPPSNDAETKKSTTKKIKTQKSKNSSKMRPGTDFRDVDPEDQYRTRKREDGSEEFVPIEKDEPEKVVVAGDKGPEIRHMQPSINNKPGPKYAGDEDWEDGEDDVQPLDENQEGFTTI